MIKSPFKVGGTYKMVGGGMVVLVGESQPGTDQHTMYCAQYIHRYVAREGDLGRVTATDRTCPDPRNLVVPVVVSVPDTLEAMAKTYRERNAVYGDNWRSVGDVMMKMFPNGSEMRDAEDFNDWHLFELIIVKLTRFANSKLTHIDSIHDIAVSAAMLEASLRSAADEEVI